MVSLETIRADNAKLRTILGPGTVAVFGKLATAFLLFQLFSYFRCFVCIVLIIHQWVALAESVSIHFESLQRTQTLQAYMLWDG